MTLNSGGLGDDALAVPIERAERCGHRDAGDDSRGGRAAAHAERNVVVQLNCERRDRLAFAFEQLGVGIDDQVAGHLAAEVGIAAAGFDGKFGSRLRS